MSTIIPISMNSNKGPRLATNRRDRFTNLHESMVSNILSRLPTKDVVCTSILSKAWEDKWRSLYNVDIDGEYVYDGNNEKFINFMNRIFLSSEHLKSVRLICRPSRSQPFSIFLRKKWISSLQNWISSSLRHNLEHFEVFHYSEEIFYASTLLNNTSLRKLILGPSNASSRTFNLKPLHGTLQVSSMNCASNLTCMSIGPLNIQNENPNSTTVKFIFPALQTLTFSQCKWLNVKHVEIYAPALTAFTSRVINFVDMDYDYTIEIVSPRLTTFQCTSEKFILDGSSIVSACLTHKEIMDPELRETIGERARNLINEFSSLEELELTRLMSEVPSLQRHDNLTRLTLFGLDSHDCEQLFELLHAMPALKFLTVNEVHMLDGYFDDAMESIPTCILTKLEEVVIRHFYGTASEYEFVVFLVKNAEQLKKLTVGSCYRDLKHFKNFISTYPPCSPGLIIDVIDTDKIS